MHRTRLRVAGQSGSGLMSVGRIIAKGLENQGFWVCGDREYPSLIKGGHSCFTINFSHEKVRSLSEKVDILIAIDKQSLQASFKNLRDGGTLVHGYERLGGIQDILDEAQKRDIKIINLPARKIAQEIGGNDLMKNTVLVGMTWKVLGLGFESLEQEIRNIFRKKPKIIDPNINCAKEGFGKVETTQKQILPKENPKTIFIDGNHALALGAIHAGVRAYFAYPMSPSSSLLTHMANHAKEFGYVVKQAEDEITVANLSLGAMHGGTRSLCATSGGGFDLMTETVSLAGIIETPFVCVVAQRPGPATGLPTWTGQGDLNLALHAGHGEFTRLVLAVSDPESAFDLIQHAFNYAEEYQIPVIVLSDKVIAETLVTVAPFSQNKIPIKRGLVETKDLATLKNTDRYEITRDGISKRWIPGSSDAYYFANSDEHDEEGRVLEDERAGDMYAKRCKKTETLKQNLPEPIILGEATGADISFIGWGSTKNTMHDVIESQKEGEVTVNYLHFDYMWPFRTNVLEEFCKKNKNLHLIEGNHTGQLGNLIEQQTQIELKNRLLKWNGRPFFIEDVETYIKTHLPKKKKGLFKENANKVTDFGKAGFDKGKSGIQKVTTATTDIVKKPLAWFGKKGSTEKSKNEKTDY